MPTRVNCVVKFVKLNYKHVVMGKVAAIGGGIEKGESITCYIWRNQVGTKG